MRRRTIASRTAPRGTLLVLCSHPRASDQPDDATLAHAVEGVLRSVRAVAAQRAELVRLEAGAAVASGLRSGALVLCAAIFAGFVAASLWISAVGAAAWWAGQRFGPEAAVGVVAGVHGLIAFAAWVAWRRSAERSG